MFLIQKTSFDISIITDLTKISLEADSLRLLLICYIYIAKKNIKNVLSHEKESLLTYYAYPIAST